MLHHNKAFAIFALAASGFAVTVHAQAAINVYGPGGPGPAMQEAAKTFSATNKVTVNVAAGPTPQWVEMAKQDADIIFSGAENMFNDFAKALPGSFELKDAYPLYLRPAAILVRPGNPKNIRGCQQRRGQGTVDAAERHRRLADLEHLAGGEPRFGAGR